MATSIITSTASPALSPAVGLIPNIEPITRESEYRSIRAYGPLLDNVFSIRYESYSAEDYIEKNSARRFMDEYDGTPNCDSFLIYFNKKLIGSIRSCVYTPGKSQTIPVMGMYREELERDVGLDQTIVEANRFVVHPDFQRLGGVKARFSIYRNIIESAIREKARCVVVAVRPAHVKFYRMFHLTPISDAKLYHHVHFKTVLMACHDIEAARDFIWSKTGE